MKPADTSSPVGGRLAQKRPLIFRQLPLHKTHLVRIVDIGRYAGVLDVAGQYRNCRLRRHLCDFPFP